MEITALKPAVKDKSRINIFINGKFEFSLTLAQLSDLKLKVGQQLSELELENLRSESNFGKLYQQTLEHLLSRPHSEKEIRDFLKRKKMKREIATKRYSEFLKKLKEDPEYREKVKNLREQVRTRNQNLKSFEEDNRFEYCGRATTNLPTKPGAPISSVDIERVITKLKAARYLDDAEFAAYYIENRNRLKGISTKKLKFELRQKGISDSLIEAALASDDFGNSPRNDDEEIEKILSKKLRHGIPREADEQQKLQKKLLALLAREGFPYELAQRKIAEKFDEPLQGML